MTIEELRELAFSEIPGGAGADEGEYLQWLEQRVIQMNAGLEECRKSQKLLIENLVIK